MSSKWRCTLAWRNPNTQPPGPKVLLAVLCDAPSQIPAEIMVMFVPGSGYSIGWECIEQRPVKRWSQAAKARVRQQNLRRRVETKFPLFADDFIAAEMARRPSYFAGSNEAHP